MGSLSENKGTTENKVEEPETSDEGTKSMSTQAAILS